MGKYSASNAKRMLAELEDPSMLDESPMIDADSAVVGVHACGRRTDLCLEAAIRVRGPVAVLPCCHGPAPKSVPRGLRETFESDVARDIGRSYRLQDVGYDVDWDAVPRT